MISPKIDRKLYLTVLFLFFGNSISLQAHSLGPDQYFVWGISGQDVQVPAGSVITEAVITIQNITPSDAQLYVHLLDNPLTGITTGTDSGAGNVFAGCGLALTGTVTGNDWSCRLSEVDDPQSDIWTQFSNPFTVTLADSTVVSYTSSLLELMDYAGSGASLGIGLETAEAVALEFTSVKLELTVSSYQGSATTQTLTFVDSAYALAFDGVGNMLNLNNTPPANNFTVSAWVRTTQSRTVDTELTYGASGVAGQHYLFTPDYQPGGDSGMGVSIGTNGVGVYEHGGGYLPALAVYQGNLGTDWNHIAVSYTNKQPRIYVNGVLVRTGLTSPRDNVYAPQAVGGNMYGWFEGAIYDVQIWDYALTAQEVAACMIGTGQAGTAGYWALDEGFGVTANDSSANGYNGSIYGASWVPFESVVEESECVLEFDGEGDIINLNNTPPTNNFTVSAWVKTSQSRGADTQLTYGVSGVAGQHYLFTPDYQPGSDSGMGISVGVNGVGVYEHGGGYLPALAVYQGNLGTNWNHIAVTYTNKQPRIYVNGVLVRTGLTSPRQNVYAPRSVGGNIYGWFEGAVTDVQIWDYALTAQEVADSMTEGAVEAGTAGCWKLDEGLGTTVFDSSANGYNGTIIGASWVILEPEPVVETDYVLDFDSTGDMLNLNNTPPANTFTVSAWVKADQSITADTQLTYGASGVAGQHYLFTPDYQPGSDSGMGISVGTNGINIYEHGGGYLPALAVYQGDLGTGWNYITVTYTNKQPRIYFNGILVCIGLTSPRQNVYAPRSMGGNIYGWFQGSVYDVQIWDYALTAQQVVDSMNGSAENGTAGYWKLDEGAGTTAFDSSANGYNGTINGASWIVNE